jgi:hypothetical protein
MNAEREALLADEIARQCDDFTRVSLVIEAVKDAQATIRAIDTKVGILLAALAIPLPYVVTALATVQRETIHFSIAVVFGWLALACYTAAVFVAIRALVGIGNAAGCVKGAVRPPDVFYLGGLYRLGWLDALFNRRNSVSGRSLEEIVASVPSETDSVLKLLVNELMILAYIRDVKLHRQKIAFELAAGAFVLALLTLLFYAAVR